MEPSINLYQIPFDIKANKIDVRPAPFHKKINQEFAVDFALPLSTPILAAENGTIKEVIDSFGPGESDESFAHLCNLVCIEHANDEISTYVHLQKGTSVTVGERIVKGQEIGKSGNSGYTTYPHLHFYVERAKEVIPIRFGNKIIEKDDLIKRH